ncbi:hypothetical protein DQW50_04255 [Halorubrum sp. 48-1-W]|uniref:hypothetical protein n=1 Tax=Halorubrum sp. 48-1-W TaxID=2249761 RepID=UPI000DCE475A|nr:hypothetical protein [Halorubrum sp. 48-1-W]RAW46312.1 hypothetical protein DQW50_04255 [Halorubrum sp. 48-1-W]
MSTSTRTPSAQVSTLRTLSILLAFTAAVGLVFGTAGFSAMEADRGLTANVTDDGNAYLGYEPTANETASGESTAVVEYRNQFGNDLDEFDVDVSIVNSGNTDASIESTNTPDELGKVNASSVFVTLTCSTGADVELLFEANGNGGGVSVSLDRTHNVTCLSPDDQIDIEFVGNGSGNGNARIDGPERYFPLDVEVETNQGTYNTTVEVSDGQVRKGGNVSGKIETVRIPEYGIEKHAPNFSPD